MRTIILGLLLCASAFSQVALRNSVATASSVGTSKLQTLTGVHAGDYIVAGCANDSGYTMAMSDNQIGSYGVALQTGTDFGAHVSALWVVLAPNTATYAITCTPSASTTIYMSVSAWSGASGVDTSGEKSTYPALGGSLTLTTSLPNTMLVGWLFGTSGSPGSGFTSLGASTFNITASAEYNGSANSAGANYVTAVNNSGYYAIIGVALDPVPNVVADPTFSPVAGTYATTQTVTPSTATSGAHVCTTSDGSTPTATTPGTCSHGQTDGTISVSTSKTLQSLGTKAGYTNSGVASAAYVIGTVANFAVSNAAVFWMGGYSEGTDSGHGYRIGLGGQNFQEVDTIVTGAASCNTNVYGGRTYQITIDGSSTTATPSAGWQTMTVFTGLADPDAHTISMRTTATNYPFFDKDATDGTHSFLSCTGSAPALVAPYSTVIPLATFSPYVALDGNMVVGTLEGNPYVSVYTEGGAIRFRATNLNLWLFGYQKNEMLAVYEAGVYVTETSVGTNVDAWILTSVVSGRTGTHEYELVVDGPAGQPAIGANNFYGWGLVFGATSTLVSATHTKKTGVGWYGDSIAADYYATGYATTSLTGWVRGTALLVGHGTDRFGYSGYPVYGASSSLSAAATLAPINSHAFQLVVAQGGINDQATSVTYDHFQTAYQSMLTSLAAAMPVGGTILCLEIYPNTGTNYANRSSYVAREVLAVAAYNATAVIPAYIMPMEFWVACAGSSTYCNDTVHPNGAGFARLSTFVAPFIQAGIMRRVFGWM